MAAEIINTVIEKIADFMEPNKNEAIRLIKDMTAGMVLVTAIGAFLTACIIFIPKIYFPLLFLIFKAVGVAAITMS